MMKIAHIFLTDVLLCAVLLTNTAVALDRSKEPPPRGINEKSVEACKADIPRFCEMVNLKQECLVAHWAKISSDCQDALATPMRNGGEGG